MTAPAPTPTPLPDRETLRAVGLRAGLTAVGFASADPFVEARRTLESRKAAGLHGDMQFTFRNPTRSTTPDQALPGVETLIAAALRYPAGSDGEPPASDAEPRARIAAYAWRDHYADLRSGLEAMAVELRAAGEQARVLADDNALVDRSAAVRAGLGWFGKNSNVLLPGQGSWFVLGAVLTTAPYARDTPVEANCGGCTRCFAGCPTNAIVADGVIDARRCLAWLLQAKDFPVQFRVALGDRIYGCDDCQEVCPPNRVALSRTRAGDGDGDRATARTEVRDTSVVWLLTASDDDLLARHGRWYIPDRDVSYLRRNALIVLANAADADSRTVRDLINRYLRDPNPMLRAHAVWAARRHELPDALAVVASDPDPLVQAELQRHIDPRAGDVGAEPS